MTLTEGQHLQDLLDSLMGRLYRRFLDGEPRPALLRHLCEELSRLGGLELVLLLKQERNGVLRIEGASDEDTLWVALSQAPERWDDAATGHGPAGRCLRSGSPQPMAVTEPGFEMWRDAAVRGLVQSAVAWPLASGDSTYVLEIFSSQSLKAGIAREVALAGEIARRLGNFLHDLERLTAQRLLAEALESAGNAALLTDVDGNIQWCNRAFCALTGYLAAEVIGENPRMLKSGVQGLRYYRDLWATIRSGKVWSGETTDRDRDGMTYTIRQTISPVAVGGRITHYLSIHDDVTQQKAARERLERAARTDEATGLLTPAAFKAEVQTAIDAGAAFALGLVSIRDFAAAMATLGPETGEHLARVIGGRVQRALDRDDCATAAAPGEYLLLVRGDPKSDAGQAMLGRVHMAIDNPVPLLGDQLELQHRVAFARFPADGASYEALAKHVDRQLADEPFPRARRSVPPAAHRH